MGPRDQARVLSGVQAGDVVVTEGSFSVRAERERLGLRPSSSTSHVNAGTATSSTASGRSDTPQTAKVVVSEKGFEPATVTVRAGTAARITFVRTTDETCATEVVFPSLNIKRALPLNEPVVIEFTPAKSGDLGSPAG